jgi:hypothetical protein
MTTTVDMIRRVAARHVAAPQLRNILKELADLEELDENINEVLDTFRSNFKMAAAIDPNVDSQLDARKKATEGLRKARQVAEAIQGILEHFPEDKTALRAAKDAAVMIKRFERSMTQTAKMVRRLSKKQMPPSLAKAANSAARMLRKFLVDPKALEIVPWQGVAENWETKVKGVRYTATLRTWAPSMKALDIVISLSTVDDKGVRLTQPGYRGTEPYDKNKVKEYFLEGMAGNPLLKGEGDRNSERLNAAPEIARQMNRYGERHGDTYNRDPEISKDGREIQMSFRTDYDAANYGQYEDPDFPDFVPGMVQQLSGYKNLIKSIEGDYSEKGWYYITVMLK